MMAFLFIWQFILSGPLEIASGYIGFARYAGYIFPEWAKSAHWVFVVVTLVGLLNIVLLYRQITAIGKITVSLWIGVMLTVLGVILTGAFHFDPAKAFDFPSGAFDFSLGFFMGLGAASRIGIYDYLGYYNVCYIGEEVKDPGRVIPRAIMTSIVGVALIYVCINLAIVGVVPWREFVPAENNPNANFIVSILMERVHGPWVATVFTGMVLWTAFGSCFALLLGYSRIPYAAALDGCFFRIFGRVHERHRFPNVSLVVIGVIAMLCSYLDLLTVIDALLVTRILVQFIGQIGALMLLRKRAPDMPRPYRMWLYPLPSLMALAGWIFVFGTSGKVLILFGLGTLALGVVFFLTWSGVTRRWPFGPVTSPAEKP
jgi:amino acid transporter